VCLYVQVFYKPVQVCHCVQVLCHCVQVFYKPVQVCHCVQVLCHCVQVFYKPLQVEKVLTDEELTVMFINWKELRLSSMKLMKSVFESVFKQGQLG